MDMLKLIRSDRSGKLIEVENQPFSREFYSSLPVIDLDQAKDAQTIQGFGIAFTDASCSLLAKLPPEKRRELLQELFLPGKLNLSMGRLNIGSSDYSTGIYSYNDTADDVEMKNFSIARDLEYLIPILLETQQYRPDIFFFASPWSPPAWMKAPATLCGGYMREKYLPAFANYITRYLTSYRQAGINIRAVSMQNEADTTQNSTMPQSLLHPDMEMELIGRLLPPRLRANALDTKLWLYDHNYSGWHRVLYMLSDPEVAKYTDAVAWHPYDGKPEMIRAVKAAHPEIDFQLTEKGPNLRTDSPESNVCWWGEVISGALNNFCRSFSGWNLALDEYGKPNLGSFDCAGLVEINSQTGEISYSAQYYAFKHFAPYLRSGAVILDAPANFPPASGISIVCARNTGNSHVAILTNSDQKNGIIQLKYRNSWLRMVLPPGSISTVTF